MKRYVCTVAAGLLLALVSTGTATAGGLPDLGQTATQATSFGDQTVGKQSNDADVTQAQGNGNVNVSPAIAIFGDAETTNEQGNDNTATASVDQSNSVDQSQSSTQKQSLEQSGGACCKADECKSACSPKKEDGERSKSCEPRKHPAPKGDSCRDGQSQAGEQRASFGDQVVSKQKNDADVTQKQGNGNVNVSPALVLGGGKHESCRSECKGSWKPSGGKAETTNEQGSGNTATADVDQSNSVEQSQTSSQRQSIVDECKGLVHR